MIELSSCPFCGGEARIQQTACGTTENNSCKLSFEIRCSKCNATAPNAYGYIAVNLGADGELNIWHDDRDKAAKAWNRREDGNMSEWIPIAEQMPPEGKYVLVYGKELYPNPNVAQIAVSEVYDRNYWSGFGRTLKITHWMPLPELPKEDNPNG